MRARFINEFDRGLNPKRAMNIGGVKIRKYYEDMLKEQVQKWDKFIRANFIGKTVSGNFKMYNTTTRQWEVGRELSVKVKDIVDWNQWGEIDFLGVDGETYTFSPDINEGEINIDD